MQITAESIKEALSGLVDVNTGQDFVSANTVKKIEISDDDISVHIQLPYFAQDQLENIQNRVSSVLSEKWEGTHFTIKVRSHAETHVVQGILKPLKNVRNIIAVASGKGGVGKSTVAVNLALALSKEGATVGILDADIYGPSQPMMLGVHAKPESTDGKTFAPLENHGIQLMSIGLMVDPDEPVIWRAPVAVQALMQLLELTNWQDLDYLIIDLPPGTGDIQLTLAQKVPVTGAIIVTTPQDVALLDAKKALVMFEKVGISVLGIIENMSLHLCTQCGHTEPVFGENGARALSEHYGVELLGELPLMRTVREQSDSGTPPVVAEPEGSVATMFREMARKLSIRIAQKPKDRNKKLPSVVVENT